MLGGLVYGIARMELGAIAIAGLAPTAAALFASDVPARRATRIDPLKAMQRD
jgi:ABC-type lipoprotein release transport system permease subunit